MQEYKREYPKFALCGLNCGLCPRYHTEGSSSCPGCGGENFHIQHPTCAVVTCNKKHDNVEFCFQCSAYPCERYGRIGEKDSFITYRNVLSDLEKAKRDGIEQYSAVLNEKVKILENLIKNYNDGRSKNFYCIAVNLLELDAIREIMTEIDHEAGQGELSTAETVRKIRALFLEQAAMTGVKLELRK